MRAMARVLLFIACVVWALALAVLMAHNSFIAANSLPLHPNKD